MDNSKARARFDLATTAPSQVNDDTARGQVTSFETTRRTAAQRRVGGTNRVVFLRLFKKFFAGAIGLGDESSTNAYCNRARARRFLQSTL